jgi:hypothetical protein
VKKMRRRASRKRNPSNATDEQQRAFWRKMSKKYGHTDIESEPLTEREREEYREMTGRPFVYEAPTWWERMREKMQKARKRNPDNDTHPTVAYPRGGGVRAGGERSPKRAAKKSSRAVSKGCKSTRRARWREAVKKAGAPKGSTLAARRAALAKAHALYKAPRCKVRKRRGKKRARR